MLVGWMGAIFYFSSIPDLSFKGELANYDFFLRKIVHMVEFGVLAILWKQLLSSYSWSGVFAFIYAISDEVHQHFVPTRYGSPRDIVIDTVGIIVALCVYKYLLGLLENPTEHAENI